MKHLLFCLAAATAVIACGGVDRAGTRDNIIAGLEKDGHTVDGQCIADVLDDYTDKELEEIDETLEDGASSDAINELNGKLMASAPTAT